MLIAIIPAKSDSRRLPNKNMQLLSGKPLLWHSIEYAKRSKLIEEICVSTDSKIIADFATENGVKVIMRPESLCGDASVMRVYAHAIKVIGQKNVSYVVGIQPDHPTREIKIDDALRYFIKKSYDLLVTVGKDGIMNGSLKIIKGSALVTGRLENIGTLMDDCINIHTEKDLKLVEQELLTSGQHSNKIIANRSVLILAPTYFMPEIKERFQKACHYVVFTEVLPLPLNMQQFDTLIPNPGASYRIDQELLEELPNIKTIITPSTGINHIDIDYCKQQGIKVLGLLDDRESLETISASAEYTFGLMMALIRNIPQSIEGVKTGHWRDKEDSFRGVELQGKTISIIGYGRIGRKLSNYLWPFNPKHIFAYDKGDTLEDYLKFLLGKSDIVFICMGLNKETQSMVDATWFDMMKDGVYLVNTSRGEIINEDALIKALESGKVKAAAVDVVCNETNFSDNKLIQYSKEHNNLIVTPHIAGLTIESQRKAMLSVLGLLEGLVVS